MGFFVVIGISEFLSATRDRTAIEYTFIEGIVRDDYFGPSQILFTAINYNYIDPLKVIISNISNSLILLNEPYLREDQGTSWSRNHPIEEIVLAFMLLQRILFAGFFIYL